MTRVTVAICTYNRSAMLREAIESVLAQTYGDMRVVIMDNCSSDDTREVVQSLTDQRIEYVRNDENLGMVGNWNRAFDLCETEYLNIFHDDDWMSPWMIENLVRIMDENPQLGVAGSGNYFTGDRSLLTDNFGSVPLETFAATEYVKATCRRGGCLLVFASALLRREEVKASGVRMRKEIGIADDVYFWLELNAAGVGIGLTNKALMASRKHEGAASMRGPVEPWIESYAKIESLVEGLGLDVDLGGLRAGFVKALLEKDVPGAGSRWDVPVLQDFRKKLERERGWVVDDDYFRDRTIIMYLGQLVDAYGRGQGTLSDYMQQRALLRDVGISIPLVRELKWLVKYLPLHLWNKVR